MSQWRCLFYSLQDVQLYKLLISYITIYKQYNPRFKIIKSWYYHSFLWYYLSQVFTWSAVVIWIADIIWIYDKLIMIIIKSNHPYCFRPSRTFSQRYIFDVHISPLFFLKVYYLIWRIFDQLNCLNEIQKRLSWTHPYW